MKDILPGLSNFCTKIGKFLKPQSLKDETRGNLEEVFNDKKMIRIMEFIRERCSVDMTANQLRSIYSIIKDLNKAIQEYRDLGGVVSQKLFNRLSFLNAKSSEGDRSQDDAYFEDLEISQKTVDQMVSRFHGIKLNDIMGIYDGGGRYFSHKVDDSMERLKELWKNIRNLYTKIERIMMDDFGIYSDEYGPMLNELFTPGNF